MSTRRFPLSRADLLILAFALLFLTSGALTLPQYGIGWDEGLGSFFFGERYYYYLATFQEKYLDFKADLSALQKLPLDTYESPFRDFPYEYPSLVNTPSAAVMHLLAYRLKWMDPVDAFHLLTVVLAALLLAALYFSGRSHYGRPAALLAALFLGLFPRFWGDMHFNSKDVPELIFFALALLALLNWQARPRWGRALAAGLLLGAALALKANAFFIPVIVALAWFPWNLSRADWLGALRLLWSRTGQLAAIALAAAAVFIFSSPYFITTFPAGLHSYARFVASQGGRDLHTPASFQPLLFALTTIPEWMLLLLLTGLVFLLIELRRHNRFALRLLLLWLVVPILRISLPNQANFDAIRHYMEFVPAAALVASLGAARLAELAGHWRAAGGKLVYAVVLLGILLNTVWIETRYHAHEHLYYNALVSGFSGARRAFGDNEASDYWAVSYRSGLAWINARAEPGAALYVPIAGWLVDIPRRVWLRPDIRLVSAADAEMPADSQPTYVMFIHRPGYYDDLAAWLVNHSRPVYQEDLDGVPILYIFRLSSGEPLPPTGG